MRFDNRHTEETKLECLTGVGDRQRTRSWASGCPRWHNSGSAKALSCHGRRCPE